MKAIRLHAFGSAPVIEELPEPPLPAGSLRLRMLAAPINPADLNVIEGKYGRLPELPATLGNEGVGRVIEAGNGVSGFAPGDLVLPMQSGVWAEQVVVPAGPAIRISGTPDPLQAAMLMVNPATAYGLLARFAALEPGDWIVQNAANSGVGRCVIQIARQLGFRTLNVCRRPELLEELTALGGDECVTEEMDLKNHAPAAKLALNAVGGASALNVANALAPGGAHVTYGAMGRQPVKIPNGLLIFKNLSFHGFWVTKWLAALEPAARRALFDRLAGWVSAGRLIQPIAGIYPPEKIAEALAEAAREKRSGKVMLKFAD
ncbi:MAG TPA: 2-enoyl thioester reductase domain-containing protein [Chthoniobacterales bacterium]